MAWKFGNIAKANERIVELERQTEEGAAALKLASDNADATTAHLAELNSTVTTLQKANASALAEVEALKAEKTELGNRINKAELEAKEASEKASKIDSIASHKAAEIVAAQGAKAVPSVSQEAPKAKALTGLARAIEAHKSGK